MPRHSRDISEPHYKKALIQLQIELVKLQRRIIAKGERILVIFEGRDAAGKDGTIKHITEHLSPRDTRVIALGPPSDHDEHSWYFQRYVPQLPAAGETVLFNRSWYNRAGVERVMGFCTVAEVRAFFDMVPAFEAMLVRDGITLIKYYLDISKREQKRRLDERRTDPLKQWKLSPIDAKAQKRWRDYSDARDEMLARTHRPAAPWLIVSADNKHLARLNVIRDMLARTPYPGRGKKLAPPDPAVVFPYSESACSRLAR